MCGRRQPRGPRGGCEAPAALHVEAVGVLVGQLLALGIPGGQAQPEHGGLGPHNRLGPGSEPGNERAALCAGDRVEACGDALVCRRKILLVLLPVIVARFAEGTPWEEMQDAGFDVPRNSYHLVQDLVNSRAGVRVGRIVHIAARGGHRFLQGNCLLSEGDYAGDDRRLAAGRKPPPAPQQYSRNGGGEGGRGGANKRQGKAQSIKDSSGSNDSDGDGGESAAARGNCQDLVPARRGGRSRRRRARICGTGVWGSAGPAARPARRGCRRGDVARAGGWGR